MSISDNIFQKVDSHKDSKYKNIGGLKSDMCQLLMMMAQSVLLYGEDSAVRVDEHIAQFQGRWFS